MKKLIRNAILFFTAGILIPFAILFLLPPTPRSKSTAVFAKPIKDSLLSQTPAPRIIFIGGSNVIFGISSQLVKDSLGLNPINTGIHASVGLMYMLDDVEKYIRKGDIVVVSPEYEQFYGKMAYGYEHLLRVSYEDSPRSSILKLSWKQLLNISRFIPRYALSKLNPNEYFSFQTPLNYSVKSFNKYGDVYTHWGMPSKKIRPWPLKKEKLNEDVITRLRSFNNFVMQKEATMFISYPGYQYSSFKNTASSIAEIQQYLQQTGIVLLGNPLRYAIPDSLIFDAAYHLTKPGVDRRTLLLIEDLKRSSVVR